MGYKNKDQRNKYAREWVAKRRAKYFFNKKCIKCNSTEKLELDHIDPSKKVSHSIFSWNEVKRNIELSKCQILCYNCHKKKSKHEHIKGEYHPKAKLNQNQVDSIRARAANNISTTILANEYNVSQRNIQRIIANKLWKID